MEDRHWPLVAGRVVLARRGEIFCRHLCRVLLFATAVVVVQTSRPLAFAGSLSPPRALSSGLHAKPQGFQPEVKTPMTADERQQKIRDALMGKVAEGLAQQNPGGAGDDLPGVEMPKVLLPGPLKPPAAPAAYRALTKLYLRRGPSRFADVVTGVEIQKGKQFEVVEAKQDEEDENLMYLRVDDEYDSGWVIDKGVAGKWAGKRVVKRVPGSLRARAAVHSISEMDRADVMDGEPPEPEPRGTVSMPTDGEGGLPPALMATLDDPAVRKLCMQLGMGPDELKKKPDLLRAVARRLYGDEVVG